MRICLKFVTVFLILMTVSANAALPVVVPPLLYQIAINSGRRMALESLARWVIVDMTNDTSWISTFQNLVDNGIGIFRMVNGGEAALQYEVPINLTVPVLDPVEGDEKLPACGSSYETSCPFSDYSFTVWDYSPPWMPNGWRACSVLNNEEGDYSSDGQNHVIDQDKVYSSFEELFADCVANTAYRLPYTHIDPYSGVSVQISKAIKNRAIEEFSEYESVYGDNRYYRQRSMTVEGDRFCVGHCDADPWPNEPLYSTGFRGEFWMEMNIFEASPVEKKDNVKRFKQSGNGFLPDETDPDWSKEELGSFSSSRNIRFHNLNEMLTIVKGSPGGMSYIEYVKRLSDNRFIKKTAYFDENVVPQEVMEELVKDTTYDHLQGEYYISYPNNKLNPNTGTDTGTGTGTDTGTNTGTDTGQQLLVNVDTSTLERLQEETLTQQKEELKQGEEVLEALQAKEIDAIATPWTSVQPPVFDSVNDDIQDLVNDAGPDINWDGFIPNVFPGGAVACHAIEYEATINSGPAGGLSSRTELDVCWVFGLIRSILSWFFGAITFIYVYRTFTRSFVEAT